MHGRHAASVHCFCQLHKTIVWSCFSWWHWGKLPPAGRCKGEFLLVCKLNTGSGLIYLIAMISCSPREPWIDEAECGV